MQKLPFTIIFQIQNNDAIDIESQVLYLYFQILLSYAIEKVMINRCVQLSNHARPQLQKIYVQKNAVSNPLWYWEIFITNLSQVGSLQKSFFQFNYRVWTSWKIIRQTGTHSCKCWIRFEKVSESGLRRKIPNSWVKLVLVYIIFFIRE